MNDNKRTVLTVIIGIDDINSASGRNRLIYNFNDIDIAFQEYEEDFKDDPVVLKDIYECHRDVSNLYRTIILSTINEFSDSIYGHSADYVLMNYSQENISLNLEKYLGERGLPQQFKSDIYTNIKKIAERLNKRFSFDEFYLIRLIEASKGKNIITEDSFMNGENKVLGYDGEKYEYVDSDSKEIYTHTGKSITEKAIDVKSFPMGNKFEYTSVNEVLKKVMTYLFENLNLCIETYRTIYSSGASEVTNVAKLADGTEFDFVVKLTDYNIPHLLGFPKASELDDSAIQFLNLVCRGKELKKESSAIEVLLMICNNQNRILSLNGLYELNGKLYPLLNWEKIILKTVSFMRGDFFKTCFCLAQIAPNKYLVDKNKKGGYVTISSTEYNNGLQTTKNVRSVLNDLLKTRKQKKDFIFRGIYPNESGNYIYTIMTGKAETIQAGQKNELLHTLQRYRNLFSDSNAGIEIEQVNIKQTGNGSKFDRINSEELLASIVEEIENEKFIKRFTPQEQAELGISISRDLSLVPHISLDAMDVLQSVHNYNGAVTSTELDEFDAVRTNGNKRKK